MKKTLLIAGIALVGIVVLVLALLPSISCSHGHAIMTSYL